MMPSRFCLFLGAFFLLSCSNSGTEKKADSLSTFLVDPVSASAAGGTQNNLYQSVEQAKLLNFSACVKDIAVLEKIMGEPFEIYEGSKLVKSLNSDSDGCLHWSENFSYNALANETYIQIERSFKAIGRHKGAVTVSLAVNPWRSGKEALIDLRNQSAPKLSDASKASSMNPQESSLYIESVSAELEISANREKAADAALRLMFEPKTRRQGLDGKVILESINGGSFNIRAQVIARTSSGIEAISNILNANSSAKNQQIRLEKGIMILKNIPKEANLDLYLEVIPENAPEGFLPLRGVAALGKLTSLVVSGKPLFRTQEITFFAVEEEKNGLPEEKQELDFAIGKVSSERILVAATNQSGRPARLTVSYKACLKNAISEDPILNQNFLVTTATTSYPIRSDRETGCLHWQEDLNFNYFASETYLKQEVIIRSQEAFYGNAEKKIALFVNPWQYENASLFLIDERYGNPGTIAQNGVNPGGSAASGKTEILLQSSFYSFLGRSFDLDNHLNLSTVRKYRFDLRPVIRRMTVQGWRDEPIGNGRYYLRALLESDDGQILATNEQTVEAAGDAIILTVPFRFTDLRYVQTRLQISLEITPLDKNSGISSKAFTGSFDPIFSTSSSTRFVPRGSSIVNLIKRGPAKSPGDNLSAIAAYQQGLKLNVIEERVRGRNITKEELINFFKSPTPMRHSTAKKLCGLYYTERALRSCEAAPESYLAIVFTDHVKTLRRKSVRSSDVSSLSINSSVNVNEHSSEDTSRSNSVVRSLKADAGVSAKLSFLEVLGVSAGVGASISKNWTTSESISSGRGRSQGVTGNNIKSLSVEELSFNIQGDFTRCANILPKEQTRRNADFFCSPQSETRSVDENYYYIYQELFAGPMVDSGAPMQERPIMLLVRGEERYRNFVSNLQQSGMTLNLQKKLPLPGELLRGVLTKYDGFYPGLLTPKD